MQLFCPDVQQVEPDVIATDPYSQGLAADGRRTQVSLSESRHWLRLCWAESMLPISAQHTAISTQAGGNADA